MAIRIGCLCIFLGWACCSVAQPLAQRLEALLADELLRTSEVGIAVFDLTEGKPLYQYQAEKLYRPASVEKVVTSVAALARLGADYTMDTRLGYTGYIANDTLHGNLYVIGGFDPEFMETDLDRLVDAVVQGGIRYVTDTLAADISLTDSLYWGPGWSWDDTPAAFQPYLSPLLLNRGCVDVTVEPAGQPDAPPVVRCTPRSDFYRVENGAVSRNARAGRLRITRNWLENGNVITVTGNAVRPYTESVNLYTSQAFFLQTFRQRLAERGEVAVRTCAYAPAPVDTVAFTPLCRVQRPIGEVVRRALKRSDNLCAESMFFHLAARHTGQRPLSHADGTAAVEAFMQEALGIDPAPYRIADGSGVSLYNYVSPLLLLEFLKYAYHHRDVFLPFYDSLPVAGIDGTLAHRMKHTPVRGNVHAKTGSVTGVSSLAGYVRSANDHQLAFVIINQNVLKLGRARAFQDKVCDVLAH